MVYFFNMSSTLLIFIGIFFIIFGAGFSALAVYLSKALKNQPLGKVSYRIFGILGIVTLVSGILELCFMGELTKKVIEIYGLVYLVFITVCCVAFVIMMNSNSKGSEDERNNS